jgi:hypothetical protein
MSAAESTTKGATPITNPPSSDLAVREEEVPTFAESAITGDSKTGLLGSVPAYEPMMVSRDDLIVSHTPPSKVEVAVCAVFFVASAAFAYWSPIYPTERPIPIQYLEGSGDYVKNLVFNETFEGETIGTLGLLALCVAAPWIVQW